MYWLHHDWLGTVEFEIIGELMIAHYTRHSVHLDYSALLLVNLIG